MWHIFINAHQTDPYEKLEVWLGKEKEGWFSSPRINHKKLDLLRLTRNLYVKVPKNPIFGMLVWEMLFVWTRKWDKEKNSEFMRNQTSDLWIPRSDTTAEVHKLYDEPRHH